MVKWARRQGCSWSWETSQAAVEEGHVGIAEWLLRNGCPRSNMLRAVGEHGHLHVLQWYKANAAWLWSISDKAPSMRPDMPGGAYCKGAAKAGHDRILDWAAEQGVLEDKHGWLAADAGNLTMMKSLVARGEALFPDMWRVALPDDNLEAADWLEELGVPMPHSMVALTRIYRAPGIMQRSLDSLLSQGEEVWQIEWQDMLKLAATSGEVLSSIAIRVPLMLSCGTGFAVVYTCFKCWLIYTSCVFCSGFFE